MSEKRKLDPLIAEITRINDELSIVTSRKKELSTLKKDKTKTLFDAMKQLKIKEYKDFKVPEIIKVKKKEKEKKEETFSLLSRYHIPDKEKDTFYSELKKIGKMKVIPQS
jgi:hypothetical protein